MINCKNNAPGFLSRGYHFGLTRLFDTEYYLRHNTDAESFRGGPRLHYIMHGWREDRWPNELFDPVFYRNSNPDVSDWPPFLHYLCHGIQEGRQPCASLHVENLCLREEQAGWAPEQLVRHELVHRQEQHKRVDQALCKNGGPCLLIIDRFLPRYDCDAGGRSTYHYMRFFVDHGYRLFFLPDDFEALEPYAETLECLGVTLLYGDWFRNNWEKWLSEQGCRFDGIFMNRPDISIKYLSALQSSTAARLLYYGHDLHFLRLEREYELNGNPAYLKQSAVFREWEERLWQTCDAVYYPSNTEIERIKSVMPQVNAKAIPLLLYGETKPPDGLPFKERKGILFVGGFAHQPNVDGVEWFCSKVLPLVHNLAPDFVFNVVGSDVPDQLRKYTSRQVRFLGRVSDEDLVLHYAQARLVVVPLRFGAGVKGKIVEALRWRTCVLTTSIGAEGMPDVEQVLAVADDEENFAKTLMALYDDFSLLDKMSKAGYTYFQEHFSYERAREIIGTDIELESE